MDTFIAYLNMTSHVPTVLPMDVYDVDDAYAESMAAYIAVHA